MVLISFKSKYKNHSTVPLVSLLHFTLLLQFSGHWLYSSFYVFVFKTSVLCDSKKSVNFEMILGDGGFSSLASFVS